MSKEDALKKAALLKQKLLKQGYPIKQLFLFGSIAKEQSTQESDIDIAIICEPFMESRLKENAEFLWQSKDIDLKIETICMHPEQMNNQYSTLAHEIKTYGIPV